jgi:hypothetical protein
MRQGSAKVRVGWSGIERFDSTTKRGNGVKPMSNLPTALPLNDDIRALDEVEPQQTLITERQVLFSSAAALSSPTRRRTRGANLFAAIRGMFVASSEKPRRERSRDVPRRYSFLENSLMAREMDRL